MSAFIVSKRHIDALVSGGLHRTQRTCGPLAWYVAVEKPTSPPHSLRRPADVLRAEAASGRRELRASVDEDQRACGLLDPNALGALLLAENQRSVNHRYSETEIEQTYEFSPFRVDPVVILKAIDCYEYQSCEHAAWEQSEAHAYCESLRRAMVQAVPGYDDAPWGIK